MSETPHLGLPYLAAAQAQKHVTVNESLQRLDSIVQLAVLDRNLTAPPATPAEGARYIVAASATGDWAGHDNQIAVWQDGAWLFLVPKEGWLAWVSDEDKLVGWTTASWAEVVGGGGGGATTFLGLTDTPAAYTGQGAKFVRVNTNETALEFATPPATEQTARLGVNIAPSSTDKFSVASGSSRFTHSGTGGHQLKVNKAAAADTASVIFQRADSGRAEFGLIASDTFQLKVSANGSAWVVGISFDHASGDVSFGGGGVFAGGLGIGGASPDAANRLAVNGAASLLTHAGTSHQLKINKAGVSDSASVVFQKGFSGRAEFGLVASDTFQLKVSADGAAWIAALQFDHASAKLTQTTNAAAPQDNVYELHNNGVLRVATRGSGITTWYLNSSGTYPGNEVGAIAYTTPGGYPGVQWMSSGSEPAVTLYYQNYDRLTIRFGAADKFSFLGDGSVIASGQTVLTASAHPQLRSYVKTSLPPAAPAGQLIYVSNDVAGATVAFSDGTNWRRVHDRAVVS